MAAHPYVFKRDLTVRILYTEMANIFKLPVEWNGQEIEYPAEIVHQGYIHKVIVDIDGALVTFEQDEEGN